MRRQFESGLLGGVSILAATLITGRASADMIAADKLPEPALNDKALPAPEGEYLRRIHAHIHKRWADNFVRLIGEQIPAANPLNEPGRTAEADLTIGADGQLVASRITVSSGFPGFDDAIN